MKFECVVCLHEADKGGACPKCVPGVLLEKKPVRPANWETYKLGRSRRMAWRNK